MSVNERVLSDRAAAFLVEELGYGPESPDYADKLERLTQLLVDVATTREKEPNTKLAASVLKDGVLTGILKGLDTCTMTATRFDNVRVADELTLIIHVPPELIATHMAVMALPGTYEKDAVKTAFYEALERVFGKTP